MRSEPEERSPSLTERARRAQIIEATANTLADLGYAQTSLAKIAATGGFSKSVISYHFDSKNSLMRAVADGFFEEAWHAISAAMDRETDAAEKIRSWIAVQVDYCVAHRRRFLAAADILSSMRDDEGNPIYPQYARDEREAIAEILREGQVSGEFRDFDAAAYAAIVSTMTESILGSWLMDPTVDVHARTRVAVDFVQHALGKDPS